MESVVSLKLLIWLICLSFAKFDVLNDFKLLILIIVFFSLSTEFALNCSFLGFWNNVFKAILDSSVGIAFSESTLILFQGLNFSSTLSSSCPGEIASAIKLLPILFFFWKLSNLLSWISRFLILGLYSPWSTFLLPHYFYFLLWTLTYIYMNAYLLLFFKSSRVSIANSFFAGAGR